MVQAQAELGDAVAGGRRALRRLGEARQHRLGALAGVEARPAQLDLEPSVAPLVGQQLGRSLEQVERGAEVLPLDRAAPGDLRAARRRGRRALACASGCPSSCR